jgi:hypothetical protein
MGSRARTGAGRTLGVSTATAALVLTVAGPALACFAPSASPDGVPVSGVTTQRFYEHTAAEWTGTLQAKLDYFAVRAAALRARVLAMPASTVLTARQAAWAKAKLAVLAAVESKLDALAAAAPDGLTVSQAAQVAAIKSDLDAAVARLSAILDNGIKAPAVTATTVKRFTFDPTRLRAEGLRHLCDGDHDGKWGDRTWTWGSRDSSWGDRDGRR